ncbi:MAG TPA: glycosyltransferase [Bacteroidales bacterium]|nr:glycosyltransferase [Bacteroidales bacterium]
MIRLSVIIPMYNVENYVERCLRSLENQNIPESHFEIICINDGSKDNSREVVIRMQQEFKNIYLIDQQNQGVSRARNNGIKKAVGKYVLFIDPDDYVKQDSLNELLRITEEKNAQVSISGFSILNHAGNLQKNVEYKQFCNVLYPGIEAYFHARGDGWSDPDRTWGILFEKDFIINNELYYLPEVPYLEDGEYIARVMSVAENCLFIDQVFYIRTTRHGSATNSNLFYSDAAINGFILAATNLQNFKKKTIKNQEQKDFINQPIVKFVILSIDSSIRLFRFKTFLNTYSKLKANEFRKLDLNGCNRYYTRLGTFFNISGYLLYSYYMVKKPVGSIWKTMKKFRRLITE